MEMRCINRNYTVVSCVMNVKLFLQPTLLDGYQQQLDMSGKQETVANSIEYLFRSIGIMTWIASDSFV